MFTRLHRTVLASLAALGLALVLPLSASADSFRYWGYYQWDGGEWAFATTGPADNVPEDGAVDGWRFHVADESSLRTPRADGDFDLICGTDEAPDGSKRVAVVMDYGTADDAPDGADIPDARGDCAIVAEDATSLDVLTEVTAVRLEDGLTCAIDDFPATGCGEAVEGDAPSDTEESVELALPPADAGAPEDDAAADSDDDSGVPVGLIVGAGAVVVIGGAAVAATRRSRAAA